MKGKHMKIISTFAAILLFSFLLTACGEKQVPIEPEPIAEVEEVVVPDEPVEVEQEVMETQSYEVLEGRTNGPMLPIYFDFDRSNIRDDQVQRVEGNADFMKENPGLTIRIEGNCDERGTNEYNMALGERRAQSAKTYLMNLGVSESQLDTISFGEEKALNEGQNQLAWSQNRRDDFVILGQ